jgi:hypothetical protein
MTACGSSAPTAATPAGRAAVRAPTCVHDDAFAEAQPGPVVYGAFAFQQRPIWPVIDEATSELVLRDLETSDVRARIAIPARGALMVTSTLAMPSGPAIVVTETPPAPDDEVTMTHFVWLVPFDGDKARPPIKLPLPLEDTYTDDMIAAGDHLVVLRRAWLEEERDPEGPWPDDAALAARDAKRPATLLVLDAARRIVHTSEEVGATGLVALDDHTFALTRATGEPGGEAVRTFDVQRGAWSAGEVRSAWMTAAYTRVGSRTLLVGTRPNPDDVNARSYALATLSADGVMSPWQPTPLVGWAVSVTEAPTFGGALLVVMHQEQPGSQANALRIAMVGPDLAVSETTRAAAPLTAVGTDAFLISDHLYTAGFSRVAKYTCR